MTLESRARSSVISDHLGDEEVVRRILDGDSTQFEILVRRHNQRLYRTIRAVLRTDEEVEDVMQQAYLNAYSHLHQFASSARFSTWLTRIAINEAILRRKRQGRAFGQGEESVMLNLVDTKRPDPEQDAATMELRRVMEAEVAALPDSLRLVFMLRDVEGMSTLETAEAIDVSEDLVRTRLHRARIELRERLFKKAGVTLETIYEFGNARCDGIVRSVMSTVLKTD